MKSHNILIEPWRESGGFTGQRGERLFRWTVTYKTTQTEGGDGPPAQEAAPTAKEIVRFGQGTARTHAEARQAAEEFLAERGIELHWQPPASATTRMLTPRSGKPRFLQV